MSLPALTLHTDGYADGARQPPHRHDALHLSLVISGQVRETVGSSTELAGPFSVVAKDAGVVHANDFGPLGALFVRLTLARGLLNELIDDHRRSPEWKWTHDPVVARPFLRLARRVASSELRQVERDDPDLIDLLAGFTARRAFPARGTPPEWLRNAIEFLRTEWRPGLRVTDVARQAGVHPVYLARMVRRWYDTTLGEELRRIRLASALNTLLVLPAPGSGATAAYSAGFADEPHFCRALRAALGVTPGELRGLVRSLPWRWRGPAAGRAAP